MMSSATRMTAGSLVMVNTVSANPPEAALTASSNLQGLVKSGTGTMDFQANNSNPSSSSLTISGSSISSSSISGGYISAGNTTLGANLSGVPIISSGATLVAANSGSNLLLLNNSVATTTNLNINSSGATTINFNSLNVSSFISGGGTLTVNGQVYQGQDALNYINGQQHTTTPSTP